MNNLMIPLKYSDLLEATQKIDEVLGDDSMYYSNDTGVLNTNTTQTVSTYPTVFTTNAAVGITYYTYPSYTYPTIDPNLNTYPSTGKQYQQIQWPIVEPMASPREEIAEPEVKLPGKRVIRLED